MKTQLSVNIDHVATVRQARRAPYPDPVEAALIAEAAGAAGITVHLRGDRRHIQDDDVRRLREAVGGKLNLEIAAEDEMLALAGQFRPELITLVPERPDEVTTEGGLDLLRHGARIDEAARQLYSAGIRVSLFVDPDPRQIEAVAALPCRSANAVEGFEINTDAYTRAPGDETLLLAIEDAAAAGAAADLRVYAGHGLTTANVGPIAAIPAIEELNIGHWLVSRAVVVGMKAAVTEMLDAMEEGEEREA